MKSLSAVICTKDRHKELLTALKTIALQTRVPDQLVVIDASQDVTPKVVFQELQQFRDHVYHRTLPGLTAQRNAGIRLSTGDLVFFFDDDVDLAPDYIARIAYEFEADESKHYGGGMGQIQLRKRRMLWLHQLINKVFFLAQSYGNGHLKKSGFPSFPHGTEKARDVNCLSGCCMAYRREVFDRFSFDEDLYGYAYMEDVDFSYRVSQVYSLFYEPSALLRHLVSHKTQKTQRQRLEMLVCHHHYLFEKNLPQGLCYRLAHLWSLVGLAVRMISYRSMPGLLGVVDGLKAIIRGNDYPCRQ